MPPLSIMVKPASGACNMRCAYCFYRDVSSRRAVRAYGAMDEETLTKLVRRAFACADGQISFAFQGGEPTLAGLPFYEKLVSLEKKYNTRGLFVQNAIQTNGYDMSDAFVDFLARENFLVGVSVDGWREAHDALRKDAAGEGTWLRATDTIRRLRDAGAQVNALCVVNALVASDPARAFEALAPFEYLQFIPCLDDFGGEKRDYSLTAEAYARFLIETFRLYYDRWKAGRYVSVRAFDNYVHMCMGCEPESCAMRGECGAYFLIEGDGSVYPCDFYVLDEWRMGSVRDDSFVRLLSSPVAEKFRAMSRHEDEACKTCAYYALCRGGCRREREPFTNGHPIRNRFCESYRAFFAYALPGLKEIAADQARRIPPA